MSGFRVQDRAEQQLDEIYRYTHATWGEAQADRYIRGLFARFTAIAERSFPWRPVPAEFGALIGDGARIGANAVISPGAVLSPGARVPRLGLVDQWPASGS